MDEKPKEQEERAVETALRKKGERLRNAAVEAFSEGRPRPLLNRLRRLVRISLSQLITIDPGRGSLYWHCADSSGIEGGRANPADDGVRVPLGGHRVKTRKKQGFAYS